jgi:hypothetical protein
VQAAPRSQGFHWPGDEGRSICARLDHLGQLPAALVFRFSKTFGARGSAAAHSHQTGIRCRLMSTLSFDLCCRAQPPAGASTYADIVNLGRLSAVVAVKLKELRRSMFWIGQSRWLSMRAFLIVFSHAAVAGASCGASKIMRKRWRMTWRKCSSGSKCRLMRESQDEVASAYVCSL